MKILLQALGSTILVALFVTCFVAFLHFPTAYIDQTFGQPWGLLWLGFLVFAVVFGMCYQALKHG